MKKLRAIHYALLTIALLLLAGCANYTVDVNITDEQRAQYEATIVEYKQKIKEWNPNNALVSETAENYTDATDNTVGTGYDIEIADSDELDTRVPFSYFGRIALAYENLGELGEALRWYKKGMRLYDVSELAWNNMGRLYDRLGKHKKAVREYQKIINELGFSKYYIDIANSYIKMGDIESAQKAYDQYRLITNFTDTAVEQYIYNLRQKRANQ